MKKYWFGILLFVIGCLLMWISKEAQQFIVASTCLGAACAISTVTYLNDDK